MTDVLTQLIDGEIVAASDGGTFPNINPTTLEVIGNAPAATADDMDRAIAAARRAFDQTTWSTDHQFRKHCLLQLADVLQSEREEFRAELIAEVGAPLMLTYGPQLDAAMNEAFTWPAHAIDTFPWVRDGGVVNVFGGDSHLSIEQEAVGVVA
ncbi:MAG TPA: aldehyde dehydrogenase family protein, partial [Ilumatobacteraceae bacterium]|nr:aldehyde dehydrogenase family protein [Ilumatobacteraceae bacterium]